jgi:hypothetical protein
MVQVKQALRNRLLRAACRGACRCYCCSFSFFVTPYFFVLIVWHPHHAFQELIQLHLPVRTAAQHAWK